MKPLEQLEAYSHSIRLTLAERSAMRARLVSEMRATVSVPSPYARFLRSFAYIQRPAFAALLVLILVGGGTAFAAENALPGDAFYGVKVAVIEPAIGALQTTPAAETAWQVELAQTRLAEAQAVANSPTLATSTKTVLATRVADTSQTAALDISALAPADPAAAASAATSLDDALSANAVGLAALTESADASATPVLAAALSSTVAPSAPVATSSASSALALNTPAEAPQPVMAPMMAPAIVVPPGSSASATPTPTAFHVMAVMAPAAPVAATTTGTTTEERSSFTHAAALFARARAIAQATTSVEVNLP